MALQRDDPTSHWGVALKAKQNRRYMWAAVLACLFQLTLFKLLYPFPDFISDSYSYIATAALHMDVNLWPVGYSEFLLFVHLITHSDTAVICCQYIILEIALLYFFFSILALYHPSRTTGRILFIALFLNPIYLFLSNCILSDALFTALTLIYLTKMLWLIHRPRPYYIVTLAILAGALFTIRYTALYFPLVSAIAFILSRQSVWLKLAGSLAPFFLIVPFVLITEQKTKAATGTAQFSVFGGWQIANNALYMYSHIQVDSTKAARGNSSY